MSELQQACGGDITTDGQVWILVLKHAVNPNLGIKHGPFVRNLERAIVCFIHFTLSNSHPMATL